MLLDRENRWKGLRKVVYTLLALFVIDVVLLLTMIPINFYTLILLFVQLVVILYFTAISLGTIKRLEHPEEK